jgi:competence protein ComEC
VTALIRRSRLGSGDLSEAGVVLLALASAFGAWRSWSLPLWPTVAVVALALVIRRPLLLVVGVGLLASALGARSWAGDRPMAAGPFEARGTLVTDPQRTSGAVHAEVRARGHHVDVWARGQAGAVLAARAAGESVDVRGAATPRPAGDDWAARRHLVGRVDADQLTVAGRGDLITQAANAVRRGLLRGAEMLPPERRALFAGFVLGDDREQSAVITDDFRGAGLSHLLVVSGENVAFVIAVAAPALRRLGPRWRWIATVAALAFFALITRFEPSVLRATFMAVLSITAWSLGRPASGVRLLALAVTLVLLVDPLLVGVLGFQLSVAASAGIVVLARPLAEHLPLPRLLALPLGVTLAAQVAVGPLLVARAGSLPVASVPANLLAEPAAALIMAWGMTAGLVAGWLPAGLAALVHRPTDVLLWWVEGVARHGVSVAARPDHRPPAGRAHRSRCPGRAGGTPRVANPRPSRLDLDGRAGFGAGDRRCRFGAAAVRPGRRRHGLAVIGR